MGMKGHRSFGAGQGMPSKRSSQSPLAVGGRAVGRGRNGGTPG